jgi:hypothetical protein
MILNISMEVKQLKIIVNATVLDNSLDYWSVNNLQRL